MTPQILFTVWITLVSVYIFRKVFKWVDVEMGDFFTAFFSATFITFILDWSLVAILVMGDFFK